MIFGKVLIFLILFYFLAPHSPRAPQGDQGMFFHPLLLRFSVPFENMTNKLYFCQNVGPKWQKKKVEIEGVGPIWRDPERNSGGISRRECEKLLDGDPIGKKTV